MRFLSNIKCLLVSSLLLNNNFRMNVKREKKNFKILIGIVRVKQHRHLKFIKFSFFLLIFKRWPTFGVGSFFYYTFQSVFYLVIEHVGELNKYLLKFDTDKIKKFHFKMHAEEILCCVIALNGFKKLLSIFY